ncbi:MAG: hypothetical protein DHS20C15_12490 [Planctomycetota bacterium]|nr:MAG: hypothetical protein DHS20C15_12490 [Planctomycetota bacterium]
MRASGVVELTLRLVFGLALLAGLVALSEHARGLRVELGPNKLVVVSPELRARLDTLTHPVQFNYYVSAPEQMPPALRHLRRDVSDLLASLAEASKGRVTYRVLDPGSDPELARFAAKRRISPRRVRELRDDAWSEREVWSTLTIAYGPRAPSSLRGLGPEHLPRLQSLIVEQLDELESPRPARIVLRAPERGYDLLRERLAERGSVLPGDTPLDHADLLWWLEPRNVTPERVAELERFLEEGGSVLVAGSEQAPSLDGSGEMRSLVIDDAQMGARTLYEPFGLQPVEALLLDENSAPMPVGDTLVPTPFRITSIALDQDFHALPGEPNGHLLFMTPTALRPDEQRLAASGWSADVLATTSDRSWTQVLQGDRIPLIALTHEQGEPLAKQALLVQLRHADPWRGTLLASAAASPFQDAFLPVIGMAHERLLQVLLDEQLRPERRVLRGAGLAPPPPLPPLPSEQRVAWRLLCLGALPVLLLLPLLRGASRWGRRARGGLRVFTGIVPVSVVALVVLGLLAGSFRGGVDMSRDKLHALHPASASLALRAGAGGPIQLSVLLSPRAKLPPALRRQRPRLDALLDRLSDAGAELRVELVDVDALPPERLATLADEGIAPVERLSIGEEARELRRLWSSLRLERDGRVEHVALPDADAWEQLEFRLAFGLQRLVTGHTPHVVFASDVPRLSAAEAHQFYQQQGLMAPRGKDVYAVLRGRLSELGYRVSHVNPREPQWPSDPVDVVVWLQPRRPAGAMLEQLVKHLHSGGDALLAVQHFNIQSRQYRGSDFDFVYWPQPQSPDVEQQYFPELGVELVREVAFDASVFPLELESQVTREERREFQSMTSALPFHVRASAEQFAGHSRFTAGLGDLPLIWPSAWRMDPARLDELGLSWQPLVRGTPRGWLYAWRGGWLPELVLDADAFPVPGAADSAETLPELEGLTRASEPLEYAGLLSGRFPWPTTAFGLQTDQGEPAAYTEAEPGPAQPARLMLLGCSEMLKDARLAELRDDFRADLLVLDAVAALSLDRPGSDNPELADLAVRRAVVRGFEPPPEDARLRWRVAVPLALPALLLALSAAAALLRRRGA